MTCEAHWLTSPSDCAACRQNESDRRHEAAIEKQTDELLRDQRSAQREFDKELGRQAEAHDKEVKQLKSELKKMHETFAQLGISSSPQPTQLPTQPRPSLPSRQVKRKPQRSRKQELRRLGLCFLLLLLTLITLTVVFYNKNGLERQSDFIYRNNSYLFGLFGLAGVALMLILLALIVESFWNSVRRRP